MKTDKSRLDESIDRSTRLKLFLQSTAPDMVLVLVLSVALMFSVSYGFNSAAGYRGNVGLLTVIALPLLVALFAGTWSKKALVPSAIATVVVAVVIVVAAMAACPANTPLFVDMAINDVDDNYVIFAFVAVVVPVLVFLLSRRPVGLVVLLAGGMFACGFIQFLYRDFMVDQGGLVASMVVLVATVALFVYQTYKQSVYSAARVKRTSFFGAFGFSAFTALVCMLVGLGVFYGAVNALNISTPDIKPFERYAAQPIDEKTGTYSQHETESDDNTTNETNEEQRDTNQESSGESESAPSDAPSALDTPIGQLTQQITGFDSTTDSQDIEQITYLILEITAIVIAIAIIALVVAAILLQRYRRKWRLKRMANKSYAEQTTHLYIFLLERLRRLGIKKPENLTPLEFAAGFDEALAPFSRGTGGVTFMEITGLYMDACWGTLDVQAEDFQQVLSFYQHFFRNAREYVGWPKWVLYKFWRI